MNKKIYLFGYGSLQNFSSIEKSIFVIRDDVADIDFLKRNLICLTCCVICQTYGPDVNSN